MDFKCQLSLIQIWKDPFLNLSDIEITRWQVIPGSVSKCLWRPVFFFSVCKEIGVTIYERHLNSFYRIMPGGLIYHYHIYVLTVSCQMDFKFFPLDTQKCTLEIQFLDSRNSEAFPKWFKDYSDDPFFSKNVNILTFKKLTTTRFQVEVPVTSYLHRTYTSGNTTALLVKFHFTRYLMSTMINTYIPSFLVVSLSFMSFWLEVSAVPGRVTLGVTALLTLATQMDSSKHNLPRVNYITGLDIWLLGCQILVFLSLVEFILANSYYRSNTKSQKVGDMNAKPFKGMENEWGSRQMIGRNEERRRPIISLNGDVDKKVHVPDRSFAKQGKALIQLNVSVSNPIDQLAKLVFPSIMFIFTSIYWLYFFNVTKKT